MTAWFTDRLSTEPATSFFPLSAEPAWNRAWEASCRIIHHSRTPGFGVSHYRLSGQSATEPSSLSLTQGRRFQEIDGLKIPHFIELRPSKYSPNWR